MSNGWYISSTEETRLRGEYEAHKEKRKFIVNLKPRYDGFKMTPAGVARQTLGIAPHMCKAQVRGKAINCKRIPNKLRPVVDAGKVKANNMPSRKHEVTPATHVKKEEHTLFHYERLAQRTVVAKIEAANSNGGSKMW